MLERFDHATEQGRILCIELSGFSATAPRLSAQLDLKTSTSTGIDRSDIESTTDEKRHGYEPALFEEYESLEVRNAELTPRIRIWHEQFGGERVSLSLEPCRLVFVRGEC